MTKDNEQNVRAIVAARFAKAKIPLTLQIELTRKCCLDCNHCYVDHQSSGQELSLSEIKSLIDDAAKLGVLQLSISGGEPLLVPDVWQVLAYGKKRNFHVMLYTSGYLIGEKEARQIKDSGVSEVHISIYSDKAQVHDSITGKAGSLESSLQAVKLLKELGLNVWFKCAVLKPNKDDILAVAALADKLGCLFQFDPLIIPADGNARDTYQLRLDQQELTELFTNPEIARLITHGGDFAEVCNRMIDSRREGNICSIGSSLASVDAFGGLKPCAFYPPIANIREKSLSEIWRNSRELERLRQFSYSDMKSCEACKLVSYCNPCIAISKLEHGVDYGCPSSSRMRAIALQAIALQTIALQAVGQKK